MADLKGKAVFIGTGSLTYSLGITVGASELPLNQNQVFEQPAEAIRVKGDDSEVRAIGITNKMKRYQLTIIPGGTAAADVLTLQDRLLLAPGTAVTLADPSSTVTDATNSGKFFVDPENGGRLTRSVDGAAQVELTVIQYVANDLSVTAS
jgi:hypothetical protein